ncbi:MAG: hypothetical protein RR192_03170 [Peptostreptococcaceae bacterium]
MMTYTVEINGAQMKFIREFFDNYGDDKVKLTLKDGSNRIKVVYKGESELDRAELENHLKTSFKAKSKYASALYYTIHVK